MHSNTPVVASQGLAAATLQDCICSEQSSVRGPWVGPSHRAAQGGFIRSNLLTDLEYTGREGLYIPHVLPANIDLLPLTEPYPINDMLFYYIFHPPAES